MRDFIVAQVVPERFVGLKAVVAEYDGEGRKYWNRRLSLAPHDGESLAKDVLNRKPEDGRC